MPILEILCALSPLPENEIWPSALTSSTLLGEVSPAFPRSLSDFPCAWLWLLWYTSL